MKAFAGLGRDEAGGGLVLVEPSAEWEAAVRAFRQEHIDAGERRINGSCGLMRHGDFQEWLAAVEAAKRAQTSFMRVPATTWMAVLPPAGGGTGSGGGVGFGGGALADGGRIVGMIQLRHELNDELRRYGGHIGYGIRPSERGHGWGTRQLALALEKAWAMGIAEVMITCDTGNAASARVAQKNGGVWRTSGTGQLGEAIDIYWIKRAFAEGKA